VKNEEDNSSEPNMESGRNSLKDQIE